MREVALLLAALGQGALVRLVYEAVHTVYVASYRHQATQADPVGLAYSGVPFLHSYHKLSSWV